VEEKPHSSFTEFSVVIIVYSISWSLIFAVLLVCCIIREGIHDCFDNTYGFYLQMCVCVRALQLYCFFK
jgi:hypothetical protein